MKSEDDAAASAVGAAQIHAGVLIAITHVFNMLHHRGVMSRQDAIASLEATALGVEKMAPVPAMVLRRIGDLLALQKDPAPPGGPGSTPPTTQFRVIEGGRAPRARAARRPPR
jgi:hypothetical protein